MPAPSVIVIGLDPERVIPPPSIDANDLKAALDTSSKDVRDAGYYLKEIWVTTDDAIGRLQKALKEREWDTVVVGVSPIHGVLPKASFGVARYPMTGRLTSV